MGLVKKCTCTGLIVPFWRCVCINELWTNFFMLNDRIFHCFSHMNSVDSIHVSVFKMPDPERGQNTITFAERNEEEEG